MEGQASDTGVLNLAFVRAAGGRTVLRAREQRFPLRMTVPFHLDPAAPDMAYVYVQNPTGGMFAGDRLRMSVCADAGARVHITTQSATKLYRTDGDEARQELRFQIACGAYLEHIPDRLIPHAGARFRQRTVAELVGGAAFVASESVGPGRRAFGERFEYGILELATEIRHNGREICADRVELEPHRADPSRAGALGGEDYLVSLLAIAPATDAEALAAAIDRELAAARGFRGAAGTLPNGAGALARMVAPSATAADRALRAAWSAARHALLGLPIPERRK